MDGGLPFACQLSTIDKEAENVSRFQEVPLLHPVLVDKRIRPFTWQIRDEQVTETISLVENSQMHKPSSAFRRYLGMHRHLIWPRAFAPAPGAAADFVKSHHSEAVGKAKAFQAVVGQKQIQTNKCCRLTRVRASQYPNQRGLPGSPQTSNLV